MTLYSYAITVLDSDPFLISFLDDHHISRQIFLDTTSTIFARYERDKEKYRWWSRDSLANIRGIGQDWLNV